MVRLFVGLEIPDTMHAALDETRGGVEEAHWQRDDQLHLTLAFIGDVSKNTMREVEDELARVSFDPFELSLSGVGMFGKPGNPKALWAGVGNKKPLKHLHEKILQALEPLELELDYRKYRPHVTLARFRKQAQSRVGDWLSVNEALKTPAETVSHFSLFSSQLTQNGSYYTVESRFGDVFGDMYAEAEFA
ncbi:RNA 2',3'-cyclic phosphodiesterase [Kordiimonas sp. SCSIO 12603]|uniref:RNA 2',3'-cyclic phosphodiesterase n=1 Tax=Kordiimonas sp. SCSIO 12603 TaxID=2829596 RepID=UPI0021079A73|nr:RNA 2',3'-cyclic phosphodiesterase [Kordiimonas sp. SCSIO 12603]UTW58540.1 RNA 2',3'-cyclic phosphodiesterase [Kordiimonas sp. SCSIO 12603]